MGRSIFRHAWIGCRRARRLIKWVRHAPNLTPFVHEHDGWRVEVRRTEEGKRAHNPRTGQSYPVRESTTKGKRTSHVKSLWKNTSKHDRRRVCDPVRGPDSVSRQAVRDAVAHEEER